MKGEKRPSERRTQGDVPTLSPFRERRLGDVSFSATHEGEGNDRRWILSAFAPGEYYVVAWKNGDRIGRARVIVTDAADGHAVIRVEERN